MAGCAELLVVVALVALGGCGAKTGLLIEEREPSRPDADLDASPDTSLDAEPDAEPDADLEGCRPTKVAIDRRRAEVIFAIDRSASMLWELEGRPGVPGDPSRWELLGDALGDALEPVDHLLEVGGAFFPVANENPTNPTPEEACRVTEGLDLAPAPENSAALLDVFDTTAPEGGTPTAPALGEIRDHLAAVLRPGVARFVVLATDGGPNCNFSSDPSSCLCTGPPEYCDESIGGAYNCLDDRRTLTIIAEIADGLGVPLFVIGIDDPNRPDLADFLDQMALTGGRPRPEPAERRFYSVRHPLELRDALTRVTESIALCLFTIDGRLVEEPLLEISVDGEAVSRDSSRESGWDWTDPTAGELTLFGEACERASLPESRVTAAVSCAE